jgi:hypothetical protein
MLMRSIRYWPDSERPRERLLKKGTETLSDAQLLAIILRTGNQGVSTLDLAIQLLTCFGGFAGLERASIPELSELKGIGPAKVAQIKAAIEISRRRERGDGTDNPVFHCSADVYKYFCPSLDTFLTKNSTFSCSIRNTGSSGILRSHEEPFRAHPLTHVKYLTLRSGKNLPQLFVAIITPAEICFHPLKITP